MHHLKGANAKELAKYLEQLVPEFPKPKLSLEQYRTPADIAVRMTVLASLRGELRGVVVDLGAGTGMLGYAAALCGANYVVGIDIDCDAVVEATKSPLWRLLANIDFVCSDALRPAVRHAHTVLSNPPFGIRSRLLSDVDFLASAFKLKCSVAYFVHAYNERSLRMLLMQARSQGYEAWPEFRTSIHLRQMYDHHYKRIHRVEIMVLRYLRVGQGK